MDSNKENFRRVPVTKIPLPKNPLPPIPKYLITTKNAEEHSRARCPLRTLNQVNVNAGTSKSNQSPEKAKSVLNQKIKCPNDGAATSSSGHDMITKRVMELDMRNVTFRAHHRKFHESPWADDEGKGTEASGSTAKNSLGEFSLVTTPTIQNLEHKEVRNIKKSLKRPHSRELQGLSPVPGSDLEKKEDLNVKRRLLFKESNLFQFPSPQINCVLGLTQEYAEDMFEYLLTTERKLLDVPKTNKTSRACVINWLMKVNGPEENPAIAQTAIWYLDSILGICQVTLENLQLVAAASYWIARKLHGPAMPARKLVRLSSKAFKADTLLLAEKVILEKLKHPPQPVIPHDFIGHLGCYHSVEIEAGATFLYMTGLMVDMRLCEEYPSVLAAAAVKSAAILLEKHSFLERLYSCPEYIAIAKKSRISSVSSALRCAVMIIASPNYEYKAPFDQFNSPPCFIAQRITNAIKNICCNVNIKNY